MNTPEKLNIPYLGSVRSVDYIDESFRFTESTHWLMVNEHGPLALVRMPGNGDSFCAALDAILDSDAVSAIEADELYGAYGFDTQEEYEAAIASDDCNVELSEGYYYMPNAGDSTGIVWLGHYWQMSEYAHKREKNFLKAG